MWGWLSWVIWVVAVIVSFAVLEGLAVANNGTTLSRFVWELTASWPPLPWLVGFVVGFLTCHFWWGGSVSFAPVTKLFGSS